MTKRDRAYGGFRNTLPDHERARPLSFFVQCFAAGTFQILRMKLEANALTLDGYVVREGMRAAAIHDGCRLAFGPDGKLWATMGEAGMRPLAPNVSVLNGKVLRVNTDGTIPDENPILPGASARTAAYSFEHRNPQGLAFEPGGTRVVAVEHGEDDHDEIYLIRPGGNYGWPAQRGPGGAARGFVDPIWSSALRARSRRAARRSSQHRRGASGPDRSSSPR